jgi:hypothetical protein
MVLIDPISYACLPSSHIFYLILEASYPITATLCSSRFPLGVISL